MKITTVETILLEEFPNIVWIRLHTDEGIVGLGETFWGAQAVAAWIHETAAPYLLGKDPSRIEAHWLGLNPFVGFNATGVEGRGRSAVDIALWDIFGRSCGKPIYELLGGATRSCVRVYNTCAGYQYVRARPTTAGVPVDNWGLHAGSAGPYEDLESFLTDAGELAEDLLSEGITGMKIWPFDEYAEASGGHSISTEQLKKGLEPFKKIRDAVGDRMDIMVELHGLWDLPCALNIARALEEYEPFWFEDPIKMDSVDAVGRFASATRIPTAASETLATRWSFRDLLERGKVGIVMFDPAWAGGISESRKIAHMAEAYHLPVAPHDCSGPVEFATSVHLTTSLPNALIQESVRAFYTGWYRELVTDIPAIKNGYVEPLHGPGLGTELLSEVPQRPDAHVRISKLH